MKVAVSFDASGFERNLALLAEAAQRFPEIRDGLVRLFETGDQFVRLDTNALAASTTNHLVVRLNPSDGLGVLVAAARARNSDFCTLEHAQPPQIAG